MGGLIKDRIVGPFFFDGSVTGNAYLQLLQQNVWPAIQRIVADEEDLVIFQQDICILLHVSKTD